MSGFAKSNISLLIPSYSVTMLAPIPEWLKEHFLHLLSRCGLLNTLKIEKKGNQRKYLALVCNPKQVQILSSRDFLLGETLCLGERNNGFKSLANLAACKKDDEGNTTT